MNLYQYLESKYSNPKSYDNKIKRFKLICSNESTYLEIINYLGRLRNEGLHPKTIKNHLHAIKIYFNYLNEIGKRKDHPCRNLKLKDQVNRQIHVESLYTKRQLESFYENYPTENRKNKIIVSLLIWQALTVQEITKLKISDIDLKSGKIKIPNSKKNKGRILNLKPAQVLLIYNYLKEEGIKNKSIYFIQNKAGHQMWSGGINRIVNKDRSKEIKLSPLKIRQSVIANLLKENNGLRMVQEFAGHRRCSSTEAYRQTGLEELKQAIERVHPLK